MIIRCVNCSKNFNINSDLIPSEGRLIKCGSCNHVWHFKREDSLINQFSKDIQYDNNDLSTNTEIEKTSSDITKSKNQNFHEKEEIVKKPNNRIINKFFSYLLVIIITFIAFIVLVDTLKFPLINFFPGLEIVLFNLFETIKDIKLFIIDLA